MEQEVEGLRIVSIEPGSGFFLIKGRFFLGPVLTLWVVASAVLL